MTREEVLTRKIDNINKKCQRVFKTVKVFSEYGGNISDIDLAKKLNEEGIKTSSSTVGRDLSSNLRVCYLYVNKRDGLISNNQVFFTEEQQKVLKFVEEKRFNNKNVGRSKGGIKSTSNNEYIKDEYGRFKGIKK